MKSPTIILDLKIFLLSSLNFCFMFYEALQLSAYTFCIVSIYHYEMVLFILSNIHYFLVFGHLMDFSALPDTVMFF